jgi:hypothetical protein
MIARFVVGRFAVAVFAWLVLVGVAVADTTITFRFNDPEALQMRQALDVFEQQNPGIKVDMQRVRASWLHEGMQSLNIPSHLVAGSCGSAWIASHRQVQVVNRLRS